MQSEQNFSLDPRSSSSLQQLLDSLLFCILILYSLSLPLSE